MSAIAIRPEAPADHEAIRAVVRRAFRVAHGRPGEDAGSKEPGSEEAAIVDRLRAAGELALSLVAETERRIVGHAALSPVTISDGTPRWYGLGPVAILPEVQGREVGTALMQRVIADIREAGARGIVVLGDPGFYGRFGFEHDPRLAYPGPPARYFQRLALNGDTPTGVVRYASAFG